ncbi:4-hydroxybutyrate dehydrogenase [Alkalithermobacter thermoalcaliphilus JW-YL-7 = DSM 7308]|uniref:4-hydroxybutyrate dehydrogenase n=2 Tax=Clostridium paradoxum TaxID=29346 RepID=A0A150FS24_CLOPD|nr:4-hydroxybutyrate dehydrogenase [[Clostridium] paradoxum JW-YL-7 = DSM 7308]SHK34302.1 4-hydroxybutyrate dehydrogenase [[Clostridium] paradoxum JW-YL-7 = DSM 7308]
MGYKTSVLRGICMKAIRVRTEIQKFDYLANFTNEFNIGKDDLIFTSKSLYDKYIKELNLESDIVLKDTYGSGEPSDEMIDNILNDIKNKEYSTVVAIGGGSIIDIAKFLVLEGFEKVVDLFERKVSPVKKRKLIAIPTTCGTGSEVTNISIAHITSKDTKMGIAKDELYPDYAVLIPQLLKNLPSKVFASSSIDALIHAVESFLSPKSNEYTELFSINAIKLILQGYIKIIENGFEYKESIIEDFIVGSNYAGIAFDNTGVGAVHALSYPLGGKYHVPHGEANYQFFTSVLRMYFEKNPKGKIVRLNKIFEDILGKEKNVYDRLEEVLDNLLKRNRLREYGMKSEDIKVFTDTVINTQQRLLSNNYAYLSKEDIYNIYKDLY